jgi:hypothetical protein
MNDKSDDTGRRFKVSLAAIAKIVHHSRKHCSKHSCETVGKILSPCYSPYRLAASHRSFDTFYSRVDARRGAAKKEFPIAAVDTLRVRGVISFL